MKKLLFLCLFIFILFFNSTALEHNTNITTDETWYPADNPHNVTSSITVSSGVTLTILAGCEVRFDYNLRIFNYGSLNAIGSSGNQIDFDYNGTGSTWWGLGFYNANSTGNLSYCTFRNSSNGVYGSGGDMITVDNCNFLYNTYGSNLTTTGSLFTNCTFQDNTTGIYYNNCPNPNLGVNNLFTNNTTAVKCNNSSSPPTIALQQPVTNNDNGFWFLGCADPVIAAGNSFTDNANYGLCFENCTGLGTLDNLTFTGNGDYGGLLILNSGDFLLGSSIINSGNNWPLTINCGSFPDAASTIDTTGNTNNDIRVTSGQSNTTGTWNYFENLDYVVTEAPSILNGGSLTIADGNKLRFNYNIRIYIYGNLNAAGASRSGIDFDYNGEGSTWWGLAYHNSNSTGNLSYCTFRNSSNGVYGSGGDMITVDNCNFLYNTYGSNLTTTGSLFTNCTFQDNTTGIYYNNCPNPNLGVNNLFTNNTTAVKCNNSSSPPTIALQQPVTNNDNGFWFLGCADPVIAAGNSFTDNANYGLCFENCTGLGTLDNLTFTGNGDYGGLLILNSGDFLLGSSIINSGNNWPLTINCGSFPDAASTIDTTGNTNNDIRVTSGQSNTTGTWNYFENLDYVVTEAPSILNGGSLTIADGNKLRFNYNIRIYIYGNLNAAGASRSGIDFDYNGEGSTWWGLAYHNSNSTGNLSYCTFRNSSNGVYGSGGDMITVDNCNFLYNTYGSNLTTTGSLFTNCTFQDNTTGIYYNNCPNPNLGVNNLFTNNTTAVKCNNSSSPPTIALQQPVTNNDNGFWFLGCADPVIAAGNSFTDNANYGLCFENCTGLGTLDNLTFTGNGDYGGLLILNSGDFLLGSSIINSGNNWPLTINCGSFPDAASTIDTTGNTNNDIRVTSGQSNTTGTWNYFENLDYVITEAPSILNGGSLTIADGNKLRFNYNIRIYIYGNLNAAGASRSGIDFDYNGEGSTWWGLAYHNSNSTGNLSYCTFRNSSNGVYGSGGDMITVDNCNFLYNTYGSNLTTTGSLFTNCTFQDNTTGIYYNNCPNPNLGVNNLFTNNTTAVKCNNSSSPPTIALQQPVTNNDNGFWFLGCADPVIAAGNSFTDNANYGLCFENCTGLGTLDNLTFTGNGDYGGLLILNSGDFLLGSSIINSGNNWPLTINCGSFPDAASTIDTTGNTNNDIRVTSGQSNTTGTWNYFENLDYVITEAPSILNGGSLTIADGNKLRFNYNIRIYIYGNLNAAGASRSGIDFDYNGEGSTWWGLAYHNSNSTGNLSYCTFRNSSNGIYGSGGDMITVDNCNFLYNTYGSNLTTTSSLFTNCTFQDNTIGIYANSSSPTIHNCEIFDNTLYGLSLNSVSIPDLGTNKFEGNGIYNNGTYDIYNGSEDISALYTYWGLVGFFNIPDRIYDVNDDANRGLVEYEPWGNAGHTLELRQGTSPTDLTIYHLDGDVYLNWTASPDATFYEVYSRELPDTTIYNWSMKATEVYPTSWSKAGDMIKEFFIVLGIIGE